MDKDGSLAAANPRPNGKRTAADMLAGAPYVPTGMLAAASSPNGGGGAGSGGVSALQSRRTPRPDVPVSVATRTGNVTSHSNITAEDDGNIDSCIICGDMGMLLCCDVCPLSYHADCAGLSKIPQGFWSCPQCVAKNLGAAAAAAASAGGAARGGVGGAAGGAGGAGGVGGSRGGMGMGGGAAVSNVSLGIGLGLQSGLDPFHQKLNACLDYSAAQCFELDGVTFQCFPPPNMALMDPAKAAAARADRERAAKAAAAAAATAQARAAAAAATVAPTTPAPAAPATAAPTAPAVDPTPTA